MVVYIFSRNIHFKGNLGNKAGIQNLDPSILGKMENNIKITKQKFQQLQTNQVRSKFHTINFEKS